MAIKLRKPEPNEERLSWCKNVDVEVCIDEGRQKGRVDFQFIVLPPGDLDDELNAEDQSKTYEFVKKVLRGVRGFKDEDGEDWDPEDQIEFVLIAPELTMTAFRAYFKHITSGAARKKA